MKSVSITIIFSCLFSFMSMSLYGQKRESMNAITRLTQVLGLVKKAPVNMTLRIESRADINTDPADNYSVNGGVYLRHNAAYVNIGETEQLLNDSLAVMINNETKQIVLAESNGNMAATQLQGLLAAGQGNTTTQALNDIYTAVSDNDGVIMTSRAKLSGTDLPRESVRLKINPQSGLPEQLVMVKRKIVVLDSAQMVQLRDYHAIATERFKRTEDAYYLVKEITISVSYESINRQEGPLPVVIGERLRKETGGEWQPVSAYADYRVTDQTNPKNF